MGSSGPHEELAAEGMNQSLIARGNGESTGAKRGVAEREMGLNAALLAVIVDPDDKQPLHHVAAEGFLYNERTHKRYAITADGIPVLLTSDAESVSDDEHARILGLIAQSGAANAR
jgi:uncharacterized protein YbaR (Trm112 family)